MVVGLRLVRQPTTHIHLPPHTNTLFRKLGRLAHFTFDAFLFSAFLAGVKRSTGLT